MEKTISQLQRSVGEGGLSQSELDQLKETLEDFSADWFEFDDAENAYFLTPEILDYKAKSKEDFEALGLGELEERIVDVLEQGKSVKWGRLALAMWLFFLFIVIYTVVETIL